MTIAFLLADLDHLRFLSLFPHAADADPARFQNDAAKNVGYAFRFQRALVLGANAGQNLTLAAAVIGRQPGLDLDGAELTSNPGTLVEKLQELAIKPVDLGSPSLQWLHSVAGSFFHGFVPFSSFWSPTFIAFAMTSA
jgi:hypothetical protein